MENKLRHHHRRRLLLQCCGAAGRCFLRGADPQWSGWTLLTTEVWGLWSWVWESHHIQSDWGRSFKSRQRCAGASPGGSQDRRHWCAIERWDKPERFSPFLHRLCRYLLVWFHSFLNSFCVSVCQTSLSSRSSASQQRTTLRISALHSCDSSSHPSSTPSPPLHHHHHQLHHQPPLLILSR